MIAPMIIEHKSGETKGYFKVSEDNLEMGRMTYSWAGPDRMIIDHTEVNPGFNGRGVGLKMVLEAVAFARSNNKKILPLCPFAKSVFDKNPELRDVL